MLPYSKSHVTKPPQFTPVWPCNFTLDTMKHDHIDKECFAQCNDLWVLNALG